MSRHLCAARVAAGAVAVLLAGAPFASAKGATRVFGVVTDPAGAPVAGAAVTLSTPLGAIAATTRSDAAGAFRFALPGAGAYELRALPPEPLAPATLVFAAGEDENVAGLEIVLAPSR